MTGFSRLTTDAMPGLDGFYLAVAAFPDPFVDVVKLHMPELQSCGRCKQACVTGTLRDKLFGYSESANPNSSQAGMT